MLKRLTLTLNTPVTVVGDGLYLADNHPAQIQLTTATIVDTSELDDDDAGCGNLSVSVDFEGWDINKNGLLYTDSCVAEIQSLIRTATGIEVDIDWSEEGMQGDDYLHFDAEYHSDLVRLIRQ